MRFKEPDGGTRRPGVPPTGGTPQTAPAPSGNTPPTGTAAVDPTAATKPPGWVPPAGASRGKDDGFQATDAQAATPPAVAVVAGKPITPAEVVAASDTPALQKEIVETIMAEGAKLGVQPGQDEPPQAYAGRVMTAAEGRGTLADLR